VAAFPRQLYSVTESRLHPLHSVSKGKLPAD
jgi:hypothetical protein